MAELHPDVVRRLLETRRFLEERLSEELDVKTLARTAKMSPFHFQRVFRQVVGESVAKHLRRLRLERAALWLKNSETPVTEIALESGFDSHAGFTHAFTKLFGVSPTVWRERFDLAPFIRQRHEGRPVTDAEALARCPLTVSLSDMPDRTLAAMRFVGSTEKLPTIWPKMIDWCRQRGLVSQSSEFLGLHYDDWDSTSTDTYRYDAAVVIPDDCPTDGEVLPLRQPGGLVATTTFEGSLWGLDQTWRMFVEQWLPVSGYQFRLNHVYDRYPIELVTGGLLPTIVRSLGGIHATLCIPVSRDWVESR